MIWKILIQKTLSTVIFNCFNNKNLFWSIWSAGFGKNTFGFWYSDMITNIKFMVFIITLCTCLDINMLHFECSGICIIVFTNYTIWLINMHIFNVGVIYLQILYFRVLINVSATTDFSSFQVEYISIHLFLYHWAIVKFLTFFSQHFAWLISWLIYRFLKCVSNCNTFFIFHRTDPCIFTVSISKYN